MKPSPEVEAVFRRIWDSAVAGDWDTYVNHLSDEPGMRIIAVAEDEWWEGRDFARGVLMKRIEELGVVGIDYHRVEGFESGSVGWVAADQSFITREDATFRRRFTVTFQLDEGIWRVVQWHASKGVSNIEAWGIELTGSLEGLVESLDGTSSEDVVSSAVGGTVTVMFTDIENSTEISAGSEDEEWMQELVSHFGTLRRIAERWEGKLVKTLGDGAMMAFPSAGAGIQAAVEMQRALDGSSFAMRVGLHTGDAVRMAGDLVGVTVAKAARVAAAASGREVLVSSVTATLATSPNLRFGAVREVELKGLVGTHQLLPVNWSDTE